MMEAKLMLWICTAACFWWSITSFSTEDLHHFPLLLRKIVSDEVLTAQISGPNGDCVDVKYGIYYSGNSIILWPCKSDPTVNQLWSFMNDGTIRSNDMCLTASGFSQKSYMMIYDCDTAVTDATIWHMRKDGEIVNPKSGLVLTSLPAIVGTELTLQPNVSSSFQTWRADNNTEPSLTKIVGYKNLCMQTKNNAVWVDDCRDTALEQRWLLFSDGTIRPEQDRSTCLSYDNLIDARVVTMSCGLAPSSERWLLKNNTILNPRTGLVLDVSRSNPQLKEIIVYPPTGSANQRWELYPADQPEGLSKPEKIIK